MATWLQTVNRNMGGERGVNTAKAVASLASGNPLGAIYYGFKAFNTPSEKGWGSAIQKTGSTTVPDLQNQISAATSNLFSRPADLPGTGGYGTTVQDVQNTITPTGGIQQPGQEAPPVQAPPVQPKIQPKTMPMPSDLDIIMAQLDPQNISGYKSSIPEALQPRIDPMKKNGGYFDINKAGTAGGNWVTGAGWLTQADEIFGKKEEDLLYEAEMRQRIANMYR